MGRAAKVAGRGLRCQQGQGGIDLHAVGIDHLGAKPFRQGKRKGRLAAGGGACNKQRAFLVSDGHMESVLVLIAAPGSGAIGATLVEIHGQHDDRALTDPASHRDLLDAFAQNRSLVAKAATAFATFRTARDQIQQRLRVLKALREVGAGPIGTQEFHASIRVTDLARSTGFYAWLLNGWPKEWTHRYATFVRPELNLNFVLLVADGRELHHDTLYHLGLGVSSRADVVAAHHRAVAAGVHVEKPPRTTWKGTPLHELWLHDPDGNLVEIYARLTPAELAEKPADELPVFLT